ncbi:MAG: hypothetical protein IJS29_06600 [Selenomonadaceae bacterium]|nr:hypothetical protein [Selenomonadaceae bacterium]
MKIDEKKVREFDKKWGVRVYTALMILSCVTACYFFVANETQNAIHAAVADILITQTGLLTYLALRDLQ